MVTSAVGRASLGSAVAISVAVALLSAGGCGDPTDDYDCSCDAACTVRVCGASDWDTAMSTCVSACLDGDYSDTHVNCLCRLQGETDCRASQACYEE